MSWTFTDDVDAFLETAGPSLAARPAENTLLLTVTATLREGGPHAYGAGDPVLGWWRGADGEVAGALVRTPPHPPVLGSAAPEAVAALADALPLPRIDADRAAATALAARWPRHRVDEEHRLYRLGAAVPPSPHPPGGHGRRTPPTVRCSSRGRGRSVRRPGSPATARNASWTSAPRTAG